MDRFRRLAIAASLSLALVGVPAMTLAATQVTYAVSGVEYAATTTVGSFAGVAVATDDYGTWQATIAHSPLNSSPATITGGTFTLDGKVRDLAGTFVTGSITLLTTVTCGKQTYSVSGSLNVTAGGSGTADFGAVLTHYRFCLWGHPITYAATVKGSVTFHL
jgi:hypothetical protein